MTNRSDSTPARSCGSASGTTVRMPPWKPAPNPMPLTAVPTKNSATDPAPSATSVIATPATSPAMPQTRTVRAGTLRSKYTLLTAVTVSAVTDALPSTTLWFPVSAATIEGPSAAYRPASAQTANSTGAAASTGPRTARGSRTSGANTAAVTGTGVTVSRSSATPIAWAAKTAISAT